MNNSKLQSIGWSNYFLQQLSLDEISALDEHLSVFRITAIHRNRIEAIGETEARDLICPAQFQPVSQHLAVGDWVLVEPANEHLSIVKVIPPKNRIERLHGSVRQVIAANLDYLWIITSANHDFNPKRLQRYLALAYEFEIEPVVILTKTDLCDEKNGKSHWDYLDEIKQLKVNLIHAVSINEPKSLESLSDYFTPGNSIALVGSSGVGKSTLINAITHSGQSTKEVRLNDDKGKHTTTHRQLFFSQQQVAIIDTPGMRELSLLNAEQGLDKTFEDIVNLSQSCKFSNCQHVSEPGCAILLALEANEISRAHFDNYKKLLKEDAFLQRRELGAYAEKQHERAFFKMIDNVKKQSW